LRWSVKWTSERVEGKIIKESTQEEFVLKINNLNYVRYYKSKQSSSRFEYCNTKMEANRKLILFIGQEIHELIYSYYWWIFHGDYFRILGFMTHL